MVVTKNVLFLSVVHGNGVFKMLFQSEACVKGAKTVEYMVKTMSCQITE
jgi:hypothetical protein